MGNAPESPMTSCAELNLPRVTKIQLHVKSKIARRNLERHIKNNDQEKIDAMIKRGSVIIEYK